jgi:hypothetical protein
MDRLISPAGKPSTKAVPWIGHYSDILLIDMKFQTDQPEQGKEHRIFHLSGVKSRRSGRIFIAIAASIFRQDRSAEAGMGRKRTLNPDI